MAGASRPFVFRFFFDAKDAKRGADEVSGAIESIGDSAEGLDKAVGGDLDKLERRLRSTDLSGATKGIGTSLKGDLKKQGKSAGGVFGKGFISNFGETIASGDLSPGNLIAGILGDVVQDAGDIGGRAGSRFGKGFMGKAASFFSSGIGLGITGAAAGIGMAIVTKIITDMQAREAEFRKTVEDFFGVIMESELKSLTEADILKQAVSALTPGEAAEDWAKYIELRDTLGLSDAQMVDILTGNAPAPDIQGNVVVAGNVPTYVETPQSKAADELATAAKDTAKAAKAARAAAEASAAAAKIAAERDARVGSAVVGWNNALPQGLRFTPRVPTNG